MIAPVIRKAGFRNVLSRKQNVPACRTVQTPQQSEQGSFPATRGAWRSREEMGMLLVAKGNADRLMNI